MYWILKGQIGDLRRLIFVNLDDVGGHPDSFVRNFGVSLEGTLGFFEGRERST